MAVAGQSQRTRAHHGCSLSPTGGRDDQEYLPLLRLAYPARVFTPIEINAADPYSYMAALTAPKIRVIPSLAARKPDEQYQLLVLSMSPDHGLVAGSLAPAPHTPPVRCTQAEQEPSHV